MCIYVQELKWNPSCMIHKYLLWRPRFSITVINTNDRISRVKPVKPRSNLGQPGSSPENLANEP
jgi:hypothetical protein